MGQEKYMSKHNRIEDSSHEIEICHDYLQAVKTSQSRTSYRSNTTAYDEDQHEVIHYVIPEQLAKPNHISESQALFIPRFSCLTPRFSKIYRILMATWCTLTSFVVGLARGFDITLQKYLSVLSGLLVNIYFIISIFLYYREQQNDTTSKNKFVRVLMHLYGTSLCLSIAVPILYWTYFPHYLSKEENYNIFVLNIHGFYGVYMLLLIAVEYIEIFMKDLWSLGVFIIGYLSFLWIYVVKYKNQIYGVDENNLKEHFLYLIGAVAAMVGIYCGCCLFSKWVMCGFNFRRFKDKLRNDINFFRR